MHLCDDCESAALLPHPWRKLTLIKEELVHTAAASIQGDWYMSEYWVT